MQHLTPKEAHDFLAAHPEAVFVDVRSDVEFLFVGHPTGALSVPWLGLPDWEINPQFVAEVKMAASLDRPVVLICRSGHRSRDAGVALEQAGLTHIYNVTHGFEGELDEHHRRSTVNGWRFEGLPWEQC